MFLKLFSSTIFSALKVSRGNKKILGFCGKKLPKKVFLGKKFRETPWELDLGQRVLAKSVDPNATHMVYSMVQTHLISLLRRCCYRLRVHVVLIDDRPSGEASFHTGYWRGSCLFPPHCLHKLIAIDSLQSQWSVTRDAHFPF